MKTILCLEDNKEHQGIIEAIFAESMLDSFDIIFVESMCDGIVKLKESCFDAIILDLELGDSGGVESVRKIRNSCRYTPIIVYTGDDDVMAGIDVIRNGASTFYSKVWDCKAIPATILLTIEKERLNSELSKTQESLKQHCESIQMANRLYLSIVNSIPEWIIRHTSEGVITFVSYPVCAALNVSCMDVIGRSMFEFVDKKYHDKMVENNHCISLKNQTINGIEMEIGDYIISWKKIGVFDSEGNLIEIQSVGRDVTGEKMAMAEFYKTSQRMLRKSEKAYEEIFSTLSQTDRFLSGGMM